jgi:hypothetical protein
MLSCRYRAILSLSRHFFLGFGLLCFQEGALRPFMPTETAVMANRRSSDGMRLLSAWNIIIDLFLLLEAQTQSSRKKEYQKRELHTRDQSCHVGSSGWTAYESTSHQ